MEQKKYKLTDESIVYELHKLYRIEALRDFGDVKKGDKGGFIEKEENLSHFCNCWVYDDAKVFAEAFVWGNAKICDLANVFEYSQVYENAKVYGCSMVCGHSKVYGYSQVYDRSWIYGYAEIYDHAKILEHADIHGDAEIGGNAVIKSKSDYIVFKNSWSSGRYFTWTRSNNMWRVGCFYGCGEELIKKAYKDSIESGKKYEATVKYVESTFLNK